MFSLLAFKSILTCCVCLCSFIFLLFWQLLTEINNWNCTGKIYMSWSPNLRSKVQLSATFFLQSFQATNQPAFHLLSLCSTPELLSSPLTSSFIPLTCPCCNPHICINPPLPVKSTSLRHLWASTFSSFPAVSAHKWVRDYSCAKSLVWEGRLLWIKHYMLAILQGASSYIHKANNRDEREQAKGFKR